MVKYTIDYEKVGLMSGIEIHQQLEGKKLFCNCPTTIREDDHDFEINRKLKAVIGETGEVDLAAAKESLKNKTKIYHGYSDTTCLVELDEEPPHLMNKNALNLCLQICKYFNSKVVDEIQIMRKTVVDGSNTTGFQRTSLVGMDGSLKTSNGKTITLPTVCIEEDSAKIVEKTSDNDIYNLSRLGIPLIEIATGPDMNHPTEIQEVAKQIGMFLRSTQSVNGQSVKRGLGTIRQDVNVSIKGGERVEIKGAQDLKLIPTLVDFEIFRQQKLLDLKKRVKKNNVESKDFINLTEVLKNTDCKFVKATIDNLGVVFGCKVEGFSGILGEETMPGRRVGSEISDYAKQAGGVGGMIHSDENLSKYKLSEDEINSIKKLLGVKSEDAFIMIADKEAKVKLALEGAVVRINRFGEGVIKEVRKANADGTTSYMRPMPGGARMYPETDTLPIVPNLDDVVVGETIEEKAAKYVKNGIKNKDVALVIAKEYSELFDFVKTKVKLDINSIASNIVSGAKIIEPTSEIIIPIFDAMASGKIPKNIYLEILEDVKNGKDLGKVISSKQSMPKEELEKIVEDVLAKLPDVDMKQMGMIMGKVMAASRGKADGKLANEIIRSKLK